MALQVWLAYLVAAIIIAITPGPGAAISMSSGLRYGYRKVALAIYGLQSALLIQLLIVAAGLGALLVASPFAFDLMKFVGAAYLAWLGIQKWRSIPKPFACRTFFSAPCFLSLAFCWHYRAGQPWKTRCRPQTRRMLSVILNKR